MILGLISDVCLSETAVARFLSTQCRKPVGQEGVVFHRL